MIEKLINERRVVLDQFGNDIPNIELLITSIIEKN